MQVQNNLSLNKKTSRQQTNKERGVSYFGKNLTYLVVIAGILAFFFMGA